MDAAVHAFAVTAERFVFQEQQQEVERVELTGARLFDAGGDDREHARQAQAAELRRQGLERSHQASSAPLTAKAAGPRRKAPAVLGSGVSSRASWSKPRSRMPRTVR